MDTTLSKKPQSFRLSEDLINKLKEMAKAQNRSLNNFVETLLLDAVYHEPNRDTVDAIEDARAGRLYGPVDNTSVETMLKSLGI